MFGISFAELMIIALLILVVLGPEKLPEVARWAGKGMRELRQASNTLRDALMIDDLDSDRSRRNRPKMPSRQASPELPPAPAASALPAPRIEEPFPSAAGPTGLDQLDDEAFDRMLAEQYRLHHNRLQKVALKARVITDEVELVEIPLAIDPSLHDTTPVALPTSASVELAS